MFRYVYENPMFTIMVTYGDCGIIGFFVYYCIPKGYRNKLIQCFNRKLSNNNVNLEALFSEWTQSDNTS